MSKYILRSYEQNKSIHNLYVSISNKEVINSQQTNVSDLINIRSMTKSIVSLLIGIALKEGYIKSLETPINYYLPNAPNHIVIRELLTMSSGFDIDDKDLYGLILKSNNWVKDILRLPVLEKGDFRYKAVDYHLLSAIISKSTGLTMSSFAQNKLFSPLGIIDFEWESDPQGVTVGSTGLRISFDSLIKLSQMLINNGFENKNEIISNDWLKISTSNGIPTNFSYGDYGFGWWIKTYNGKAFYRALGSGGQQILIYPKERISIIVTADKKTFNLVESETFSNKILDIITLKINNLEVGGS
ncbi:serine hydrolase domain-containing protein [Paucisalibacillus globulus]|uniref:serine hydrolase domain-containing protein n=1 Tax=Paucisalibacillus globulus TaxID=351095 RepID=UPI0003FF5FEA|nr:serine hydrolase [Paucisalibacillus globulus]